LIIQNQDCPEKGELFGTLPPRITQPLLMSLLKSRNIPTGNFEGLKFEYSSLTGNRRTVVGKTVQTWFNDIHFNETEAVLKIGDGKYKLKQPIKDFYGFTVDHPVLLKLTKRLELASKLDLSKRWSSSYNQVS
jgi:hypothetical protein